MKIGRPLVLSLRNALKAVYRRLPIAAKKDLQRLTKN